MGSGNQSKQQQEPLSKGGKMVYFLAYKDGDFKSEPLQVRNGTGFDFLSYTLIV
jgi:hypothetical protein